MAAAALACVAALAGCASSSPATQAPASTSTATITTTTPATSGSAASSASSPSSATVGGPQACPNGSLKVAHGLGQGYAGGVYEVIDFTNTSGSTCTLTGYPGVSLVSGPSQTQIGLAAKRSTTTPVRQVTLAPGATANALLQIVDALNYPNASCGPVKATALKIYPPNQTAAVLLPETSNGCAKPIQLMYIGAVQPGSGGST